MTVTTPGNWDGKLVGIDDHVHIMITLTISGTESLQKSINQTQTMTCISCTTARKESTMKLSDLGTQSPSLPTTKDGNKKQSWLQALLTESTATHIVSDWDDTGYRQRRGASRSGEQEELFPSSSVVDCGPSLLLERQRPSLLLDHWDASIVLKSLHPSLLLNQHGAPFLLLNQ
jgi:hypothetical protein